MTYPRAVRKPGLKLGRIFHLLLAVLATNPVAAGDGGMQRLFDDVGMYGNVTGPGAYDAQGVNVLSGGSLFMRVPQRTTPLVQAQLPSLRMGCGGIDLYAGSFSFISKDMLVSLMKNIGSSAVAYAFKLALDSISPQINKTLTELQQVAQDLNATNINSCEAGEALARGTTGDWQRTAQYFAKVAGPITGRFTDHSEARAQTQADNARVNETVQSLTDPVQKAFAQPGNIGWRALSGLPGLDAEDRTILMAISGTVVIPPNAADQAPLYHPPRAITVAQFIRGNEDGKLPVFACRDGTGPDECLDLGDAELAVTPFARKVEATLLAIAGKFRANARLSDEEIAFINVTALPVYKALAVSTAMPTVGLDNVWIGKYADLIAAEYAYQYIVQATYTLRQAYAQATAAVPAVAQDDLRRMIATVDRVKADAREELRTAYAKAESVNHIADEILYMERTLMANLPANLAGNLRFAAGGR
ncbi:conjugative transfer pilus assembly protein TraH [Pseudoduganella lurida]|uniref:Conjugative transfer pilus assembly protein TraH n=1 Tax=Pseudoduganella lurida TaxID=1036180 RepID=A0A562RJW3_9BURK|nr:conjugal transfer protein TraH [Pseudoduganella lurida]TWI69301.1 conjugative transfer pilus assembly protein TraH [Pseudoduganella lurida]